MDDYKYKNSKLFLFLLFIASLIMGIGYSAINTTLEIKGSATASPKGVLYISNIEFSSAANTENETSTYTQPDFLVFESSITLDAEDTSSYIEYNITISNKSDNTYAYKGAETAAGFYSNNDIVYTVSGINEYEEISPQGSAIITIRFQYADSLSQISESVLDSSIAFNFVEVYSVTYQNSTVTTPSKAYNGEDLVVNIGADYTYMNITIGGTKYRDYSYVGEELTIPGKDIWGDIAITPVIDNGTLTAELSPSAVDLSTGDYTQQITLKVTSTYSSEMVFSISTSDHRYQITDLNGNSIDTITISENGEETYTFNLSIIDGSAFDIETDEIYLTLDYKIATVDTNKITATLPLLADKEPPTINAIELTGDTTTGDIIVNWSGQDNGDGEIKYTINLYKVSDDSLAGSQTYTSASLETLTTSITGITVAEYYYVKIYGTDEKDNTGESYLGEATTETEYCRKSEQIAMFSVTPTLAEGITSSNQDTYVVAGGTYETTFTNSNTMQGMEGMTLSVEISSVTMNGVTLEQSAENGYTYSSNTLTIPNVTGNLAYTASSGTCLLEGTEITLANGSKKKIENIDYTDLLLVWDFEQGKFTYEYPIWIEKGGKSKVYQKTTFSDGSTLKTVGYHGIFSVDDMRFVSVDNRTEFNVGTKVIKVDENNEKYQFKEVTVTDIEIIFEDVNYYQIVTTTYYNIISDDYMTTDGNVILVNLYGFNKDYTWKTNRQEVIADKDNLFEYKLLESVMPYYMFAGLRAAEVKYISKLGYFSLDQVPKLMKQLAACNNRLLLPVPIRNDGNRYWMVTTSDDIVTESNKEQYMCKENSYYTLPKAKNEEKFSCWYNTASGEKYLPGDKVQIIYGTHFVAIYE